MKKIVLTILAIILIGGLLFITFEVATTLNEKDSKVGTSIDSLNFIKEYSNVSKDNKFIYADVNKILEIINGGTGIIFFGFPSCPWCQVYVPVLDEVIKEKNIDKVYYYNPKEIRQNETEEYKEIVKVLKAYLDKDDENNERLYVPHVFAIKNGKVIGENNSMSTMSGNAKEYFTEEKKSELKTILTNIVSDYSDTCSDILGSKGC